MVKGKNHNSSEHIEPPDQSNHQGRMLGCRSRVPTPGNPCHIGNRKTTMASNVDIRRNGRGGSNHPVLISQHIGSTGIWLGKAEIVVTTPDKWHPIIYNSLTCIFSTTTPKGVVMEKM